MPASFPSSVKSWTDKQDLIDDVFAGDINGAYHEIIAIENELMQIGYKRSVRVATTQNGDLATAFANGQTVDDVVLATGDRILIKDQTNGAENGIYIVNASGAPTRATDANSSAHMVPGMMVYVREGTVNAKGTWKLTTTGTVTLGTTPLTFENELASHLADIAPLTETTDLVSSLLSYFGIVNKAYVSDNGTRFYILPRDKVTSGMGGVIKIFADPYHLQTDEENYDYRDLGIYFSQDQNGDTGYNRTGVYWINSKVMGPSYDDKNPDIAFSFQDGSQVAGRIVRLKNAFGTYTCFIIGSGNILLADKDGAIRGEVHGNLGFRNNDAIKWLNAAGTNLTGVIYYTTSDRIRLQGANGIEELVNNVIKRVSLEAFTRFDHAVIHNTKKQYAGTETTVDASGTNLIKFAQSAPTTITSITGGQHGQELTLYFTNGNTTIQNSVGVGGINLAGASNFIGSALDTLTLIYIEDRWVEKCRSIN